MNPPDILWFGIKDIAHGYIDAVQVHDCKTGLLPFMLASGANLSSSFELLRMMPDVLKEVFAVA